MQKDEPVDENLGPQLVGGCDVDLPPDKEGEEGTEEEGIEPHSI